MGSEDQDVEWLSFTDDWNNRNSVCLRIFFFCGRKIKCSIEALAVFGVRVV